MKVIIAGWREFKNYEILCEYCDKMLQNKSNEEIEIVSGKAPGADALGESYAKLRNYKIAPFPALWNDMSEPCLRRKRKDGSEYNALAGPNRNQKMADYADVLIAFYNGNPKSGTADMIRRARKKGIPVRIYNIKM